MGAWKDFAAGFKGEAPPNRFEGTIRRPTFHDVPREEVISRHPAAARVTADNSLQAEIEELRAKSAAHAAKLADARAALDDAYASNDMLAGELREAREELHAARTTLDHEREQLTLLRAEREQLDAAPAGNIGKTAERKMVDRLWRVFAKEMHPQRVVPGETVQQGFERMFKAVNAEVQRIKEGK